MDARYVRTVFTFVMCVTAGRGRALACERGTEAGEGVVRLVSSLLISVLRFSEH